MEIIKVIAIVIVGTGLLAGLVNLLFYIYDKIYPMDIYYHNRKIQRYSYQIERRKRAIKTHQRAIEYQVQENIRKEKTIRSN